MCSIFNFHSAFQETDRRWREFRQMSAAHQVPAEVVLRRNAVFLLGLCPTSLRAVEQRTDPVNTNNTHATPQQSRWSIDLFPACDAQTLSLLADGDKTDVTMSGSVSDLCCCL